MLPKPYYQDNYCTFYQGDCLKIMEYIESQNIDMILCDLPYGITGCKWDITIPFQPMWEQLKRITKKNGTIVLFGSQPFTSALIMSNPKMFKYEWIWKKTTSGGFSGVKYSPMKYHENILIFSQCKGTYNPKFIEYSETTKNRFKDGESVNRKTQLVKSTNKIHNGMSYEGKQPILISRGKYPESVLFFKSVPNCNGIKLHPTQKPIELMEYLINTYTNKNETILDFTMGSGTTLVAAKSLERKSIGIEIEEKYCEITMRRLNQEYLNL